MWTPLKTRLKQHIAIFDDIPQSEVYYIAKKEDRLNYMGNNQ